MCSPCFGLFSDLLDIVEARNRINNISVFSFLKSVLAESFPERGGSIEVKSPNLKTGKLEIISLKRSEADSLLEYV